LKSKLKQAHYALQNNGLINTQYLLDEICQEITF